MSKLLEVERSTNLVTEHVRCTGLVVYIRGKLRCSMCGHRLTVNGTPPVATRKLPPWTWHLELIDRRRARAC